MKLLSCEIQNFGGLSGFSRTFNASLTVIEEKNGFGKTTLAEFFRAMFYGFPNSKAGRERRNQYRPWQGGTYGGVIVFEHNGTRYRVERRFGKTPGADICNVYNDETGQKSPDFSERLGEELFQLDADSYERSVYLSQITEITEFHTDSIQAKLSDLVNDTGDVNNYEKAWNSLKKMQLAIEGRGAKSRKTDIQNRLDALSTIPAYEHELNGLFAAMEEQNDDIARKENTLLDKQEELKTVREQTRRAAEAAGRRAIRDTCTRMEIECDHLREELDAMGELTRQFESGSPSEEDISACQKQFQEYLKTQSEFDACVLPEEEERRFAEAAAFFAPGLPPEEEWTRREEQFTRIQNLREKIAGIAAQREDLVNRVSMPVGTDRLIILAAGAGIVLLLNRFYVHGGIVLGAGAVCFVGAAYLHMIRMVRSVQSAQKAAFPDPDYEYRQSELRREEQSLSEFVSRFTPDNPNPVASMPDLQFRYREYRELLRKSRYVRERREELSGQSEKLEGQIRKFLELYTTFPGEWNPEQAGERLNTLKETRRIWQERTERLHTREKELQNYREEHREELENVPEEDEGLPSLEELHETEERLNGDGGEIPVLREEIAQLRKEYQDCQRRADEIPVRMDERRALEEQKAIEEHNSFLLKETRDYLEKAQERLSSQYLDTVRQGFEQYAERLLGMDARVSVGRNLEVSIERSGSLRVLQQTPSFSAGETDMILLCMRLALVDALFEDTQPFLILDDPFVNLDDAHTRKALDALDDLSRDHQIIYLVCNSSRVRRKA